MAGSPQSQAEKGSFGDTSSPPISTECSMSGEKRKILVTGATGQVGGAVARLLAAESGLQVIAGARSPEKAKGIGAPVVLLDYDREETLPRALDGVDAAFLVTGYTVD